jgi:hypothetical protein
MPEKPVDLRHEISLDVAQSRINPCSVERFHELSLSPGFLNDREKQLPFHFGDQGQLRNINASGRFPFTRTGGPTGKA